MPRPKPEAVELLIMLRTNTEVTVRPKRTEASEQGPAVCMRLASNMSMAPVRVRADHVEAVARLVGPAHGEGDQRRQVAREEVAPAGLEAPLIALGQLLEARGQQATAALLCARRRAGSV